MHSITNTVSTYDDFICKVIRKILIKLTTSNRVKVSLVISIFSIFSLPANTASAKDILFNKYDFILSGLDQLNSAYPWINEYPYEDEIEEGLINNDAFLTRLASFRKRFPTDIIELHIQTYLKSQVVESVIVAGASIAVSLLTGNLTGSVSAINLEEASRFELYVDDNKNSKFSVTVADKKEDKIDLPENFKNDIRIRKAVYRHILRNLIKDIVSALDKIKKEQHLG